MENRITQALNETKTMLERAVSYMPEHRDTKLIDFCVAHIAKLESMLKA